MDDVLHHLREERPQCGRVRRHVPDHPRKGGERRHEMFVLDRARLDILDALVSTGPDALRADPHLQNDLLVRMVAVMDQVESPQIRNEFAATLRPLDWYRPEDSPPLQPTAFQAMLDFVIGHQAELSVDSRSMAVQRRTAPTRDPHQVTSQRRPVRP
jgi:hypothetical protein